MATKAQIKTFIDTVGSAALAEARKRKASGKKWVLPGICVAQGACESGWGTSQKMVNANALFGIKVGKSKWHFGTAWKDKAYSTKTKECYDGKTYEDIVDLFRAYDSINDAIIDYMDIITSASRYSAACNKSSAKETITAIKNGGYATSPTYISTIMNIYNAHPEIAALDAEFLSGTTASSAGVLYYPKCTKITNSIVDALQSVKVDSNFNYRKKIAEANGITGYTGTPDQNIKLLNLLKEGKLKKA